jgi:hypothetical protein
MGKTTIHPDDEAGLHVTKLDAARRQLRLAIRLTFEAGDPCCIHTLAAAAGEVLANLVAANAPGKSWDDLARKATGLTGKQYFDIKHAVANFLKHAKSDPEGERTIYPIETDGIIFMATMDASVLGPMEMEESLFQLWFWSWIDEGEDGLVVTEARRLFGDLRGRSRAERIAIARPIVTDHLTEA